MAKKTKYYVVWEGREKGVFTDWDVVKKFVIGYDKARYKGFDSQEEANAAFEAGAPKITPKQHTESNTVAVATPSASPLVRAIAVDAACSGNPGKMEYRGVSLWDGKEIFHMKFEIGTNNIGEFLAIVHALGLLKQHNAPDITIYSDSQIAQGWVKAGQCRTKLELTPRTAELMSLVKRAETWLKNNKIENPIVKWPTEAWGEIPADFGRK